MSSAAGRGRGGKFQKPKRGGGKHFSRDLRPVDADGVERSMWADPADQESSSEESSEEESSEEESSEEEHPQQQEMTREQRKAAAKARKEAAIRKAKGVPQVGDMPPSDSEEESDDSIGGNPNLTAKARAQAAKGADPDATESKSAAKKAAKADVSQLSRREREALQAQQAKERYAKLHAEGKTEEARNDMERLKLVRQRREEEAARKEAEKQEREEHEKAKAEQIAREERQRALAMGGPKKTRGKKKA